MTPKLQATLAATTITVSYDNLLLDIHVVQETDLLGTEILPTLFDVSTADESHWTLIGRALIYERKISVPCAPCSRVTDRFHANPKTGHFGGLKNAELVSPEFH
jgi:hypothetical protein